MFKQLVSSGIGICFLFGVIWTLSACGPVAIRDCLKQAIYYEGGIERMDTSRKDIYLTFTGGDYNDGGPWISQLLETRDIKANFFFTGDFYRDQTNYQLIQKLKTDGHYLGAHSDKHLLYCSWENRDSLLVTKEEFNHDLMNNYEVMKSFGVSPKEAIFFMPPYEWYNQQISNWTKELGLNLITFTPGTRSNADYTTPDMGKRYISSSTIYSSILDYEENSSAGLNGFILLIHIGTHPDRTDKFYKLLPQLFAALEDKGYVFRLMTDCI